MHTIYAIENKIDGKSYVGRTGYVDSRRSHHMRWVSKRTAIGRAIQTQGATNFTFRVLDTAQNTHEASLRERLYIHLLESNNPQFGYNDPRLFAVAQ